MASKLIIFLVFAAAARSSAAVEQSELEGKLSTIEEASKATLTNFYAVVDGFFKGIYDKQNNGGLNEDDIKQSIIDVFQDAYDTTADGLRPIAKNTAVIEEVEAEEKEAIKELALTAWSLFDVTPASENSTATLEQFEVIEAEITDQVINLWNGIFDMMIAAIDTEVPEIKTAIQELRPKAIEFALRGTGVIGAAIKIWVTKLAPGLPEPSSDYSEAFQILQNLGRASMSGEVNQKFCLFQYIATYYYVFDAENVNTYTQLMLNEIAVATELWKVFGEVLWLIDNENNEPISYDELEKRIGAALQAAYYSTWDSILTIRITGKFKVRPDERIPKLAALIREAAELAVEDITPEVSDKLDVIKQEAVALAYGIWKNLYENLERFAEDIEGAESAITSAWSVGSAGLETAINYLFEAMEFGPSEGFLPEEGIKYSVWSEVSTKFIIIRACRLVAYLSNWGIEVPFSSVYNYQLVGLSVDE